MKEKFTSDKDKNKQIKATSQVKVYNLSLKNHSIKDSSFRIKNTVQGF